MEENTGDLVLDLLFGPITMLLSDALKAKPA